MEPTTTSATQSALSKLPPLDRRIPSWPQEALQPRSCPFCLESTDPVFIRPDDLPVAFCASCSLWYVTQVPSEEHLAEFYRSYFNTHRPEDLSKGTARMFQAASPALAENDPRIRGLRRSLRPLSSRRVLDVGCGLGQFLVALRLLGAGVVGIDECAEARTFLSKMLHIPCVDPRDSDGVSRLGRFDAVTMVDLIEHPLDPKSCIENALSHLKTGGLLLIWTPNGSSIEADPSGGGDQIPLRVDLEHFQYFTPHSIQKLAQRYSLVIEHLEVLGHPDLTCAGNLKQQQATRAKRLTSLRALPTRVTNKLKRVYRDMRRSLTPSHLLTVSNGEVDSYHLFALLRTTTLSPYQFDSEGPWVPGGDLGELMSETRQSLRTTASD